MPGQLPSIDQVERYMTKCAATLQRLHTQRTPRDTSREHSFLVHRDFKPDNVVIDESDEPWILDFGLAAPRIQHQNSANMISGTLRYMAPEQLQKDSIINNQTDIWAWGATFYELLTGTVPFDVESPKDYKKLIDQSVVDPPSSLVSFSITSRIEKVLLRCLRKERRGKEARYANFGKVLRDLKPKPKRNLVGRTTILTSVIVAIVSIVWALLPASDPYEVLTRKLQSGKSRLDKTTLVQTYEMIKNGNTKQKEIAEKALQRHRWVWGIDHFLASGFGFVEMSEHKAVFEGSEVEIWKDIKRSLDNERRALFDDSFALPSDFRSATNGLINDLSLIHI